MGASRQRTQPADRSRHAAILAVGAGVFAVLLYYPVTSADFIPLDDPQYVLDNPYVLQPTWGKVCAVFGEVFRPTTVAGFYQPLTMVSLMLDRLIDASISGGYDQRPSPFVFRLHNVILHGLNAALVVLLVWSIGRRRGVALMAGLLFAAHPMNVEVVAWVCQRKALLSATFALLTLYCYCRWARRGRTSRPGTSRGEVTGWYAAAVGCYVLSLLAKPTSVLLPFVLLLFDVWPLRRLRGAQGAGLLPGVPDASDWRSNRPAGGSGLRRLAVEKAPFFVLAAAGGLIAYISQERASGTLDVATSTDLWRTILVLSHNVVFYFGKVFMPIGLCPHYTLPPDSAITLSNPDFAFGVTGVLVFCAGSYVAWKKRWRHAWTMAWGFLLLLGPTLGALRFMRAIAGDRFAYLPMVLLIILVIDVLRRWRIQLAASTRAAAVTESAHQRLRASAGSARLDRFTHAGFALALIVVGVLASRTHAQLKVWRSGRTYYGAVAARFPDDPTSYLGLATAVLFEHDQWLLEADPADPARGASLLNEAAGYYRKALELGPGEHDAYCELAEIARLQGRPAEALAWLEQARGLPLAEPKIHYYTGLALGDLGRYDEAIEAYRRHLTIKPNQREVLYNLANALMSTRRTEESLVYYQRLFELDPSNADGLQNWGTALATLGYFEDAISRFRGAGLIRARRVGRLMGLRREQELSRLADAAFAAAGSYAALGKEADAIDRLRRACELKPELLQAAERHPLFEKLKQSRAWLEWRASQPAAPASSAPASSAPPG